MKTDLLDVFCCPVTGKKLHLIKAREVEGGIESGELITEDGIQRYPIVNFIARFALSNNYAESFGFQWHRHRKAQLDSYSGLPISRDRFFQVTGWPEHME